MTSEASYCRSLDIVVEHFVKSKQLEMLLTSQENTWLFSRLYNVRVISRRSEKLKCFRQGYQFDNLNGGIIQIDKSRFCIIPHFEFILLFFSFRFLSRLEERLESNFMHFTVCDIIVKHCPLFRKVYVPYLTNQSYQDATYQKLM